MINSCDLDLDSIQIAGSLKFENLRLSTDSRVIEEGMIFFALKGENFDGSDYLISCLNKGARGFITSNKMRYDELISSSDFCLQNHFAVLVENDFDFLQKLAMNRLARWRKQKAERKVISITGSNGKTTNKDLLDFTLKNVFNSDLIHSTKGNYNNHIGLPLTILELKDDHEFLILEMGTNHPGEIKRLCDIAHPDIGYITNIGESHLEFLGSLAGVFKEKKSLYDSIVKNNGIFIINKDDSFLSSLSGSSNTLDVGKSIDDDFQVFLDKNTVKIKYLENEFVIQPEYLFGKHNLINCSMVFALCSQIVSSEQYEKVISAINSFQSNSNRSQLLVKGEYQVYLDAYNANPSSMTASIESYLDYLQMNKIETSAVLFILGDMNELGNQTESAHRRIAELLNSHNVEDSIFIGRFSQFYADSFNGNCKCFLTVSELSSEISSLLSSKKYLFLKASRSVQLEKLIDFVN